MALIICIIMKRLATQASDYERMATQASNYERMATQERNYSTSKSKFVYGMNDKRNLFSHLHLCNCINCVKYSNVGIMSHH